METGTFTQMIHPAKRKSMVLDNCVPITREKFVEWMNSIPSMNEGTVVYYLDGSIKARWREHAPVVTIEYKPIKN